MLCKYKNIFNEPGKGIHSYRLFDIAIFDVLATIIAAYILHIILSNSFSIFNYNFIICLILLFSLGIFFHWLFCVETTITKKLSLI